MTRIALEPFYLHREQVTALLGPTRAAGPGQHDDGARPTPYCAGGCTRGSTAASRNRRAATRGPVRRRAARNGDRH